MKKFGIFPYGLRLSVLSKTIFLEKHTTVDETEHIYDGITSTDDSLPVKELWNVMKMAYDNGFIKLYEEFQVNVIFKRSD